MPATLCLNCFTEGEDIGITVTATSDDNASHLKKSIRKERSLDRLKVPHTLELWKFKDTNPMAAEPGDPLLERIGALGRDFLKFADKLGPTKSVFSIFRTEPHRDHIHIIVMIPRTHQKLPSHHPLHKLWMLAREPRSTLFETRPVQRDKSCQTTETKLPLNCIVLKGGGDWVQDLQPEFFFTGVLIRDDYVMALRAIKKWFLSIGEVTEDATEVDDVEPAPLENPFLDVPTSLVSKYRAFVLLGDPGIGKTAFLYVLLVLRLQARLPTIIQSRDTHLYHFADDGVYLIYLIPSPIASNARSQFHKLTWCLIDSNQSLDTVPVLIQDLGLVIVQASQTRYPVCHTCPRPHRSAWMDKASRPIRPYFMKSWTLAELLAGRVLQDEVCSGAQIEFFSARYGTQAHLVYINASHLFNYETSLLEKMASITYEGMGKLFRKRRRLFAINLFPFPLTPLAIPFN